MIMVFVLLIVLMIIGSVAVRDPDALWELEAYRGRRNGIEMEPTERWYRRTRRGGVVMIVTSIGLLIFSVYANLTAL